MNRSFDRVETSVCGQGNVKQQTGFCPFETVGTAKNEHVGNWSLSALLVMCGKRLFWLILGDVRWADFDGCRCGSTPFDIKVGCAYDYFITNTRVPLLSQNMAA